MAKTECACGCSGEASPTIRGIDGLHYATVECAIRESDWPICPVCMTAPQDPREHAPFCGPVCSEAFTSRVGFAPIRRLA